jgi:hypothetical protein
VFQLATLISVISFDLVIVMNISRRHELWNDRQKAVYVPEPGREAVETTRQTCRDLLLPRPSILS